MIRHQSAISMFIATFAAAGLLATGCTAGQDQAHDEGNVANDNIANDNIAAATQELNVQDLVRKETIVLEARGDEADVFSVIPPKSLRPWFRDRFPVVVFLQGALVGRTNYEKLGRMIALQGFVVVIPDRLQSIPPGAPPSFFTDQQVLNDALAQLEEEDQNPTSPFYEIVDTERSAVAGHSFGGVAGLFAVDGRTCNPPFCFGVYERPESLKAGVFYGTSAVGPTGVLDLDTTDIPVALVQGSLDGRSVPENAQQTYDEVLDGTRALITIDGANHFGLTDDNVIPGAIPDPIPQELSQRDSIRKTAAWTGRALRAFVKNERLAKWWIFRSGGSLDGSVTVQSERAPQM